VQAESLRSTLGSSLELDKLIVQHETKAPDSNPRRTELRLKSRKKRGLLVVSEKAMAKPTEDIVEDVLPTEIPSSIENTRQKAAQRKIEGSLHDPSLILRSDARSPAPSIVHPDITLALKSGRCREDGYNMYEAGDGDDGVQKMQSEEQEDDLDMADVSVSKSRKRPKRRQAISVAPPLDEPVSESQGELVTKRRSQRDSAQRHDFAPRDQGDTDKEEHGTVEARIALPPAPRLVRLSRKSVRSKELIGFAFDDTDAQSGIGGFSINPSDLTRTKSPNSYLAPPVPVQADIHDSRAVIGKDREPVDIPGDGAKDAALRDCFILPLGADPVQSFHRLSRSPLQQLSSVRVESLEPCAQETIKAQGVTVPPAAETEDREANKPAREDISTVPPKRLPEEKQVARGPSVELCLGQKTIESTTVEDDAQLEIAPLAPREPPKLVNPATRGRKAALKSHAAGQVPQPILPADIGVQAAQNAQREQPKDTGPRSTASCIGKALPKIKMTLPGFVSAKGGGPWSREAHDLLETGRPS
jgi:hypothetical protein